jgi:hypothetical protein
MAINGGHPTARTVVKVQTEDGYRAGPALEECAERCDWTTRVRDWAWITRHSKVDPNYVFLKMRGRRIGNGNSSVNLKVPAATSCTIRVEL